MTYIFCELSKGDDIISNKLAFAIYDKFPVNNRIMKAFFLLETEGKARKSLGIAEESNWITFIDLLVGGVNIISEYLVPKVEEFFENSDK